MSVDPRALSRALRRARIGIYLGLVALLLAAQWRYDLTALPEGSISPLDGVPVGRKLIVDVHPGAVQVGDAVLWRADDGALWLSRVEAPPAPRGEEPSPTGLWLRKEVAAAAGPDSTTLGPIAPERIVGRVVVVLPF